MAICILDLCEENCGIKRTGGIFSFFPVDQVEVGEVLREPLEQLKRGQAVLSLHFAYALPTETVYARLDVNKFNKVLANLFSNAFKFTPDGGQVMVDVEACRGT